MEKGKRLRTRKERFLRHLSALLAVLALLQYAGIYRPLPFGVGWYPGREVARDFVWVEDVGLLRVALRVDDETLWMDVDGLDFYGWYRYKDAGPIHRQTDEKGTLTACVGRIDQRFEHKAGHWSSMSWLPVRAYAFGRVEDRRGETLVLHMEGVAPLELPRSAWTRRGEDYYFLFPLPYVGDVTVELLDSWGNLLAQTELTQ